MFGGTDIEPFLSSPRHLSGRGHFKNIRGCAVSLPFMYVPVTRQKWGLDFIVRGELARENSSQIPPGGHMVHVQFNRFAYGSVSSRYSEDSLQSLDTFHAGFRHAVPPGLAKVPRSQGLHSFWPRVSWKRPSGHLVHIPGLDPFLPRSQEAQNLLPF